MSSRRRRSKPSQTDEHAGPPFVGALLRLCWQRFRRPIYEAIQAAGFLDLQETHFAVFTYPHPEGLRLSELARQIRMSRQATNYLIAQLEDMGYIERRVPRGGNRRLLYLTARGRRVAETIYTAARQLQGQWAREVGQERFAIFLDVLKILSAEQMPSPNDGA